MAEEKKLIGKVTHYFTKIAVAAIEIEAEALANFRDAQYLFGRSSGGAVRWIRDARRWRNDPRGSAVCRIRLPETVDRPTVDADNKPVVRYRQVSRHPVDFGGVAVLGWTYFGVIAPEGFTSIEYHETEGKAEDQVILFADRFTFAFAGTDPWADLGHGLAGAAGTPVLTGTGTLAGGDPLSLQLAGALPNAPLTLVIGAQALLAPFKGGVLVPLPTLLVSGLLTDGGGAHVLGATWPPGLPAGSVLYFQAWIVDPAGPAGFSASNGLSGTTP